MNIQTKKSVDLAIVGGGIFGASIAYYYKRDNPDKEVIVYERNELCSGNTSFAAGLMSRVRSYDYVIPLSLETYRVIPELEKLTGDQIPVHYDGAIHLAVSDETVTLLENTLQIASSFGIDHEDISSLKAEDMAPWLKASEAKKITFFPGEATVDPYLLGMAFINAAKKTGVRFMRKLEVTDLLRNEKTFTGVKTSSGIQRADITVLAAGVWSIDLAFNTGISLPMAPVRSQYWITEISESLFPAHSPTVIIPEANFFSRPQGNALLFGIRETDSMVINPHDLPEELTGFIFSEDNGWNDLVVNYEKLERFFPMADRIGIKNYIAGFSAYTPDNLFIAGEVPGINGLLVATGCVGAGISVSGGIGLGIALLAAGRTNPFDFSHYKPDRFGLFDPYSKEHLTLCAEARSKKTSG
jgi:4-methylaminobutanoate oxidase (formaldehyde-forming)